MQIEEGGICASIPPMFRYKCPVCGNVEFDPDKYPMPVTDLDKNYGSVAPPLFFDWQAFRAEAAKNILAGFASAVMKDDDIMAENTTKDMVNIAISWADELVRQLKDETQG